MDEEMDDTMTMGVYVSVWLSPDKEDMSLNGHLTRSEYQGVASLRNSQRQRAFLRGRLLSKRSLRRLLAKQSGDVSVNGRNEVPIEILRSVPTAVTSRPVPYVNGAAFAGSLSLSHDVNTTVVACTAQANLMTGIDICKDGDLSPEAAKFWFSPDELQLVCKSQSPAMTVSGIWSAKEAAFKTLGRNIAFCPQDWHVSSIDGRWCSLWLPESLIVPVSYARLRSNRTVCLAVRVKT